MTTSRIAPTAFESDSPRSWEQISGMAVRDDMRRDDDGYTVFDIWTGWPALVNSVEQVGLDIEVAEDLVDLLNILNDGRKPLP